MSDGNVIEARRRRYQELREAGQGELALPPPSALPAPPIPDDAVIARDEIPGGWYTTCRLRRGEALRLVDPDGVASVSLLAWRADLPGERINVADTVKVQWSAALRKGRIVLTDMGRVMVSLIEDSSGAHDVLAGGSTAASVGAKFGLGAWRNTRDNFVAAVGKLGLDKRDIGPCLTLFAPVFVSEDGTLGWREGVKRPGDFVDLRAEIDLLVALSNCPHPLDPTPLPPIGVIEVVRFAPGAAAEDICRTATAEAIRAFERTEEPA